MLGLETIGPGEGTFNDDVSFLRHAFLPIFSSGSAEPIFMKISGIVYLDIFNIYSKNQISTLKIDCFIAFAEKVVKNIFFTVHKMHLKIQKNIFFTLIHRRNPL